MLRLCEAYRCFAVFVALVMMHGCSAQDVAAYNVGADGELTGELKKWHKITLSFVGPPTSEPATPNPFTYYRLDVTFTHVSTSKTYVVPGYYGADGNASNTGATSGPVWLTHFAPDEIGAWEWSASFTEGTNVAQNGGGSSAGYMDGTSGTFDVTNTDKTGRDHRGKGRLQYVGEHHLRFAETGEWFLKVGADSPENFLAYDDFDNTPNFRSLRKDWGPHLGDYQMGDPTWAGGKGRAIIGALNYLANQGMNAFSFLTMNINGDDRNVYPYISNSAGEDRQRIDVSKTAQWEVVFEHADHLGLYLHFKTQETENDQLLDRGGLGNERRLYYRELIARYSHHLALNWNIGEENTNTETQRKNFADYFKAVDPYDFPVVIHTYPFQIDPVYSSLLGHPTYDGASVQTLPANVFPETLKWVEASEEAGRKWVVANDEQGNARTGVVPDTNNPTHDDIRTRVLWGNMMAGGAGVEYYFGYSHPNSDLTCQDWRSRASMWAQSKHALDFFTTFVPFWEMSSNNDIVSSPTAFCLSNNEFFVIYLQNGGTTTIDLPDNSSTYEMSWYDPRNGGDLQQRSTITGGQTVSVGTAPNNPASDWAVLIAPVPIVGDLILQALLPNPIGRDAEREYVVLTNPTSVTVDFDGEDDYQLCRLRPNALHCRTLRGQVLPGDTYVACQNRRIYDRCDFYFRYGMRNRPRPVYDTMILRKGSLADNTMVIIDEAQYINPRGRNAGLCWTRGDESSFSYQTCPSLNE